MCKIALKSLSDGINVVVDNVVILSKVCNVIINNIDFIARRVVMSDDVRKNFPKLLKYYLMMNNKTQKDLVDYLGVSQSAVSNWVSGIRLPDAETISKIAKFLHVEVQDLLQEDNKDKPEEPYYMNDDAREIAQFLYENPDYKVLFDASRKVKPDDIAFVKSMLDRFKSD